MSLDQILMLPPGYGFDSAPAWTPAAYSPHVWLDSTSSTFTDAGTTPTVDTDPVYQWNDLSGNGYHFRQATLANRPVIETVSGVTVVTSDGTDDVMRPITQIAPTDATLALLVYKVGASNDDSGWGTFSPGGNTHSNLSNGRTYDSFGTNTRADFVGPTWSGNWIRYVVTSKAGEWTARANGSQLFTRASNTVAWNAAVSQGICAGNATPLFPSNSRYRFMAIFPALTGAQITTVEDYLLTLVP